MQETTIEETILIVDDDPILRESLSLLLSRDYKVEALHSASEALSYLASQENLPVLGLFDYMMPGVDGIELLELIKEKYSELPVIMLTASDNIKSAVRAMRMGATDYINKPFDVEELLFRIADSKRVTKVELIKKTEVENNLEKSIEQSEKEIITLALEKNNYIQTKTADYLGITRRVLKYKMDKLGLTELYKKKRSLIV